MIYAGILAAGLGVRMHRLDMPKQFLPLGEKPILVHTLEQFFMNEQVDKIIVVAPDDWLLYAEDLISRYNPVKKEVCVISGGVNKTESVAAVVRFIDAARRVAPEDVLITHDAIRPFLTQRMINENIDAARACGAANTVMPTSDTIAVSADGKTLDEIPLKAHMFAEQTPQTFLLGRLKAVFERAAEANVSLENEMELAGLYMRLGGEIRLVRGEYSNIKIINPYDLEVANALLKERQP